MIVFFLPNLRAGGAERVMMTLLKSYTEAHPNENVMLLLGELSGPLRSEVPPSVTIESLEAPNAFRSVKPLIRFLKKHQPDILFSCLGSSVAASVAKWWSRPKTIVINRLGNTIGAEKQLIKNPIKRTLYIYINRFKAIHSDHIIFQCQYMAADFIRETAYTPKKYDIIYNPVNVVSIQKAAEELVDTSFSFVAVGRLHPQKDYPTLLEACAILKQRHPDFTLAIIGEGMEKEQLLQQTKELQLEQHVFFLGHQSNPYPYMKQVKLLVSSSRYEGFSNVIIESLCLGTPVIATDSPGG
ncbi:MAG: glycosyltransferase, partial [Flavobacterium sp.]